MLFDIAINLGIKVLMSFICAKSMTSALFLVRQDIMLIEFMIIPDDISCVLFSFIPIFILPYVIESFIIVKKG